nr:hypothetical protein [Chitinophagales bacterium]
MISEDNKTSLDINLINDLASPQNAVTDPQRRDFLKKLGFSVAAASLAASCAIPERKSVPYVKRPEEIVPGMASYYATVFNQGGQFINVMVKNREGRPIKIESNPNSVISKGGTTALAQASIASLYDSKRFHKPKIGNKQVTWAEIDSELIKTLENLKATNKKVALVTSSIPSPSS